MKYTFHSKQKKRTKIELDDEFEEKEEEELTPEEVTLRQAATLSPVIDLLTNPESYEQNKGPFGDEPRS